MSTLHFEAGQRELELGHLDSAKATLQPGAGSAAGVAVWRPHRTARSRPFRPARRADQRLRGDRPRPGRRVRRAAATSRRRIDEILAISTFEIPAPSAETTQAVTADLQAIVHDIDIPLNAKVLSFVQLFTGRLKSYLEEGLSRGMQYLPMIQDVFRAEGLPLDLAYIPLVESAFKPSALSRAKARGIWQFMRGTGARERPDARLVHRRAGRAGKGDARRRQVPQDAERHVRRRLAPGARLLQRRPRPRAARRSSARAGRISGS